MVFLESALESKFNPLVHLGRKGSFGLSGFVNKFNAEAELLDDLVSCAHSVALETCLIKFLRMITGRLEATRQVLDGISCWDLSKPYFRGKETFSSVICKILPKASAFG